MSTFEELERQLAFAPPEALRRQMEAAERLAHEVTDEATYPFEFVLWRITAFRSTNADLSVVVGRHLRADLATFVLHVSERLLLAEADRPGGATPVADLARELGVTEKTLRRWRARGLLVHSVRFADGRQRVAAFRTEVDRFRRHHPDLVAEAGGFSRMDEATEQRVLARVRELVADGCTPNLAAKRAAAEVGRSHEGVRQLLLRSPVSLVPQRVASRRPTHGARAAARGRSSRERELAYRAWRFGVPMDQIVERLTARPDAIRRRIDAMRAERLRALRVEWIELPTFERPDAAETMLGAEFAVTDLAPRCDPFDVIGLLRGLTADRAAPGGRGESAEESLVAILNFLKRRAWRGIAILDRAPDRGALDRIETDLRWASRVHRRLVERLLSVALLRVEQSIGGPLQRRSLDEIRSLLSSTVSVVAEVVASVDPSKRQGPRRLVALEADRMMARQSVSLAGARAGRAGARHELGAVAMPLLFTGLLPWDALLEPLAGCERALPMMEPRVASLLGQRYGWLGSPPRTLEELAELERTTVARMTARVTDAEREARSLRRRGAVR
jgi:hypothetical protein